LTTARADAEALDVLAHILGGGATSRLYRALVIDQGLAADAGAWYQGAALDATRFGVYASPRPGTGLIRLEQALDGVIAELAEHGVTADELARRGSASMPRRGRARASSSSSRPSTASSPSWPSTA